MSHTLVNGVFNVGGNEGGALIVKIWRLFAFQGHSGDFLHFDPKGFISGFFQKRTGAGRTGLVHGIIRRHPVGDIGVFGILTADFKNGVHFGVKIDGSGGMRDDFVDDTVGEGV